MRSISTAVTVALSAAVLTAISQAAPAADTSAKPAFCKEVTTFNAQYSAAYAKKPSDSKGLTAIKVAGLRRIEKVAAATSRADFEAMAKHYETGAKAGAAVMRVLGLVNTECKVDLA